MTPHSFASRAALLATVLAAGPALGAPAAEWPSYKLQATIDPPTHRLKMDAEVTLPEAQAGKPVDFVLGANFKVTASSPAVAEARRRRRRQGIRRHQRHQRVARQPPRRHGVPPHAARRAAAASTSSTTASSTCRPTVSPEEYARSFAETPGHHRAAGRSTSPAARCGTRSSPAPRPSELMTYSLTVNTPPGWHLIAPGNGIASGADGMARWESPSAVDEISLSGGPLTPYSATAGTVQAEVFLREPDAGARRQVPRRHQPVPAHVQRAARALPLREVRAGRELLGDRLRHALLHAARARRSSASRSSSLRLIRTRSCTTGGAIPSTWTTPPATGAKGSPPTSPITCFKEVEGQGAEYRRDTLKKYRDFASTNGDFPLREFRSRHSAATEAVGYGKTLMGFHMLRRQRRRRRLPPGARHLL